MRSNAAEVTQKRATTAELTESPPGSVVRIAARASGVPSQLGDLIAASSAMRSVFDALNRLSVTDVTLTLVGETGTGKDVLANTVHALSSRRAGPFVVFDCGAVAPNLAESELFGHERGSFTGAVAGRAGAFELAHCGTLFLDEVGELPLDLQPRLLRALESRRVRRLGGANDRAVDVRVMAATNRDLRAEVAAGRFRQDLFFRLAGAVVPVPPLRDRVEDLPILVSQLLSDLGHSELRVTRDTLNALADRDWPGNVRELKNALACAVAFYDGGTLEPRHFSSLPPASAEASESSSLDRMTLLDIERMALAQTLKRTGGNKAEAARSLGIATSTLYEKIKKHGL
jgi:DNA-binding NtrC family response regulator